VVDELEHLINGLRERYATLPPESNDRAGFLAHFAQFGTLAY
jgi:hypothetical protein